MEQEKSSGQINLGAVEGSNLLDQASLSQLLGRALSVAPTEIADPRDRAIVIRYIEDAILRLAAPVVLGGVRTAGKG